MALQDAAQLANEIGGPASLPIPLSPTVRRTVAAARIVRIAEASADWAVGAGGNTIR